MKTSAKTSIWFVALLTLALLTLLSLPSCSKKQPEMKEIKIGWIGPLTGDLGYYGQMIKKATDLAVEEINAEGGINGANLEIIYHDDTLDPKKGVSAFLKLVTTNNVPLVVQAAGSSVMLAEAPLAEKHKVVLISPTCSNPDITFAGDYVFRTWPSDTYQGISLARFAVNTLKKQRVALLFMNNDYGTGVKDEFSKEFKSLGGDVVISEAFEEGATDFRGQLVKVKAAKPDMIFLASHYREGALVLRQAKEFGLEAMILASDACYAPEFLELAKGAAEGSLVANLYWDSDSDEPRISHFVTKFRKKYGQAPEVYAAAGYDCIKIVTQALREGGTKPQDIKQALYQIEGYEGVTGEITIDKHGDVSKQYDIFIVKNGEFRPYEGDI